MSALDVKIFPEPFLRKESTKDTLQVLIDYFNEHCKGIKYATKAKHICEYMNQQNINICPQFLRDLIFQIRNESLVPGLCGTPQIGYFVAVDYEDMDNTIRSLESRLIKQIRTYRAMKAQRYRMKLKGQIEAQKETPDLAGSRAPEDY